jgi:hypothetical protein
MKMTDAKKEIEDKLFAGAPLSLDTMMCALVAINAFIEQRGETSSLTLEINIPDEAHQDATQKLNEELQKGFASGEKEGWLTMDDVKRHLGLDEQE